MKTEELQNLESAAGADRSRRHSGNVPVAQRSLRRGLGGVLSAKLSR